MRRWLACDPGGSNSLRARHLEGRAGGGCCLFSQAASTPPKTIPTESVTAPCPKP